MADVFLLELDEGLWESPLVVGMSLLIGLNSNFHGRGELMNDFQVSTFARMCCCKSLKILGANVPSAKAASHIS